MKQNPILHALGRKGADKEALAGRLVRNPALLPAVIEGLSSERASIRLGCGAVLDRASAVVPGLLAAHRDRFVALLSGESRILRWNATRIVGNLAAADPTGWFDELFDLYFAPIDGKELIAAANVIGSAAAIALAEPRWSGRVAGKLLAVERARYQTPECRNVALGHAILAFDKFYQYLADPGPVLALVKRQLKNTRPATAKKARRFLERRALLAESPRTRTAKPGRGAAAPRRSRVKD
jgi:hypothetical protein